MCGMFSTYCILYSKHRDINIFKLLHTSIFNYIPMIPLIYNTNKINANTYEDDEISKEIV